MGIVVVFTRDWHFQLECYFQLVLVDFFGLYLKKHFPIARNTLQLHLFFSTMFFSWNVVEDVVLNCIDDEVSFG
jgi:hypothetical protein